MYLTHKSLTNQVFRCVVCVTRPLVTTGSCTWIISVIEAVNSHWYSSRWPEQMTTSRRWGSWGGRGAPGEVWGVSGVKVSWSPRRREVCWSNKVIEKWLLELATKGKWLHQRDLLDQCVNFTVISLEEKRGRGEEPCWIDPPASPLSRMGSTSTVLRASLRRLPVTNVSLVQSALDLGLDHFGWTDPEAGGGRG